MKFNMLVALVLTASTAHGQPVPLESPARNFTAEEISKISRPVTKFVETPNIIGDYDKYFYFHRADTKFDEAYADVKDCDGLSSGPSYRADGGEPSSGYYVAQYGIGGAIGGALGGLIADAIYGVPERRRIYRVSLRNCMYFKGYKRYGLDQVNWEVFNFNVGDDKAKGSLRDGFLLLQAKVASDIQPTQQVIEP